VLLTQKALSYSHTAHGNGYASGYVRLMPSRQSNDISEDRLHDVGGEERHAQDAADVGNVDLLGRSQLLDGSEGAGLQQLAPPERAIALSRLSVRLRYGVHLIQRFPEWPLIQVPNGTPMAMSLSLRARQPRRQIPAYDTPSMITVPCPFGRSAS
jgi:hypothetical protein